MIPIIYRLRESIRFEDQGDHSLVISEAPLNVVRASRRAVRILQLCNGIRTLPQIAAEVENIEEKQLFRICDYFNKKSVLETSIARNSGFFPSISVVIPTRDRGDWLIECLESIYSQDYPMDRVEVIVIDDGSVDETRKLAEAFPCALISNRTSLGQSICRNMGVRQAKGEVLAFLDDDCVAGPDWLRNLVPCFQWDEVGAVGGYVDGYATKSSLSRYEKEFSLLNLGKYILRGGRDRSTFYVPTCNMLVRKKDFVESGGIREKMHLGEDVDFCWRLRDRGRQVLYIPSGAIKHKHRDTHWKMLRRRSDYGTSEAILCKLHPNRVKALQIRLFSTVGFLGLSLAVVLLSVLPVLVAGAGFLAETGVKAFRLHRKRIHIPLGKVCFSVLRMWVSSFYALSIHLVRYYLIPLLLVGFAYPPLWILSSCFLALTASVDYFVKRPRLAFPVFLLYYVLDHLSYQFGVMIGCLRERTLRPFRLIRSSKTLDTH